MFRASAHGTFRTAGSRSYHEGSGTVNSRAVGPDAVADVAGRSRRENVLAARLHNRNDQSHRHTDGASRMTVRRTKSLHAIRSLNSLRIVRRKTDMVNLRRAVTERPDSWTCRPRPPARIEPHGGSFSRCCPTLPVEGTTGPWPSQGVGPTIPRFADRRIGRSGLPIGRGDRFIPASGSQSLDDRWSRFS